MNRFTSATAAVALLATPAFGQETAPPVGAVETAPAIVAVAKPVASGDEVALPANTEILLSLNEELTTKGGRIEEGHRFRLSVVHDVTLGDYVVIPKGTPAVGEVTWKTGKGAFGKSGKMEIEMRYLELGGRRIPLSGQYRQEGEGNTVATVAGVIAAGVFAGFITGKSARIPQGRELKAFTTETLPVALPAGAPAPESTAPIAAVAAMPTDSN